MFVKKLVEKASIKKPGGNSIEGLKASDVDPRVVFHQGIPSGGTKFAYDSIQKILALSTKDGRIKLYGKDNAQALLDSSEPLPRKFLQFIQNQGILLNVTSNNHIEVWDTEKKILSDVYVAKEEITCFAVIQHSFYMYIGHSSGNISVLELEKNPWHIVRMKYTIPFSASYGNSEASDDTTVMHILPQPAAESKRVLVIFRNGQIILWDIQESRTVFRTGGNMSQSLHNETKKVTSACWACPFGSKVVVGYSNGEIFIWSVPSLNIRNGSSASDYYSSQSTPLLKLNLGYKSEKIPIGSIKWLYAGGKASRLYVMGTSDYASSNLLQVVLLNEQTESRTIKLGLLLSESCVDMEIISTLTEQGKQKQDSFILLGKSGHVHLYDDTFIERYLLQCQSKSTPSLPKDVTAKLPLADSSITAAKFITNNTNMFYSEDEYYKQLVKDHPLFVPIETNQKDGMSLSSAKFSGFSKVQNLYITGHSNGAVNFWDASCPLFIPILQLKQQSENDFSLSGIPLTTLYFDINSPLLVSGDQSGTVRVFRFKPEPYATNIFSGSKKGTDHIIQSVKIVKINGAISSVNIDHSSKHLAVGSDQGHVSVFNMDDLTLLYQKHISSEISAGIVSLQFLTCSLNGFDKNILAVGTKDSSVLALDNETGNMMGTGTVHPKKPSKALFMQVFDGQSGQLTGSIAKDGLDLSDANHIENATTKQLHILLCSEKALYVYSLVHAVQGVKKVLQKKKFHSSSCCWASTFYGPSGVGLVLLFTDGRVELRSLPELSLIVETSIRGFNYSPPKAKSFSDWQICCSSKGDLVLVNGDQEMLAVSLLVQRSIFRILDSVSCVYRKEMMLSQEELVTVPVIHKEKKKGLFSSFSGNKEKHVPPIETEDSRESIQKLSMIFSEENFPSEADNNDNLTADEDEVELNIDDIDLDDHVEKRKDHGILGIGALNKKKLTGKFQALKGRLKEMKGNIQKTSAKEEQQQEEQPATVDQIKKRYGFSSSSNETSVAKMAESKLQENLNEDLGKAEREIQSANQKISSLNEMYKRLQEYITSLQQYNGKLHTELSSVEDELKRVEKEKATAEENIAMLKGQLTLSISSQEEATKQKDDLASEVYSMRGELKQVRDDRDRQLSQAQSLNAEFMKLKESRENSCIELDSLTLKASELEEKSSLKENQIKALQEKLAAAEKKLQVTDVSVFETRTEFEGQQKLVDELQRRLEDSEYKLIEGERLRKKLHNTILELKGNIRVFCRVRPLLPDESRSTEGKIFSYPLSMETSGRGIDLAQNGQKHSFKFDKVFIQDVSQEEVFVEVSQLVQSALDGYKVCIFAYGQTGSGKTYTMMGRPGHPDEKGLIPRSLEQIFQAKQSQQPQGWKYEMQVSMLEIYNETIRDLLSTNRSSSDVSRVENGTPGKQYTIKHDVNGNTHVSDLTVVDVHSAKEVAFLLNQAANSRSVGKTQMNEQSSRSHFVFTLRIYGVNESTDQQVQGVLNLIDLAGSERLSKSGSTGDRLRETQAINKSLSSLSDVIFALAKKEDHVPFRNSKLTYLLQPCLGGDSKTLMFVNISPDPSSVGESLCSLRFASRVNACEIGTPRRQTNGRATDSRLSYF